MDGMPTEDDVPSDGSTDDGFSRRRLLRTGSVFAGGLVVGSTATATPHGVGDRQHTDEFEEREWGYVRSDFEPPSGPKAAVLQKDGYGGAEPPTHYVRMRDGILVAVAVGREGPPLGHREEYVPVQASIRGTGCSGGTFDLYDRAHAQDGYELVEWLADRPWSFDGVGLYGASYSGITAAFIAAQDPPSLAAVMPNNLIADQYRGNRIPGGVPNEAWGITWMNGLQPALDTSGTVQGAAAGDEICAQNVAERDPRNPADEPTLLFTRREDDTQWRIRSLVTYADGITVPTYIGHNFQDRGTGPRGGPEFFRAIDPDPVRKARDVPGQGPPPGVPGLEVDESPKRLKAMNGCHVAGGIDTIDAERWFDYWLLGERSGVMDESRVTLHLNRGTEDSYTTFGLEGLYDAPEIDWTRFYFGTDGRLQTRRPDDQTTDAYVTGNPRQTWPGGLCLVDDEGTGTVTWADGPDVLQYRSGAFGAPKVIAGPITATLYIESTAPEMDLFVTLADEHPDGSIVPLQIGLLRASHRSLDERRTLRNDDGDIIRPYHPHTNSEPIVPGDVNRYDVEVWPLGHLVYPGHRLRLAVHTPPAEGGLWGYEPSRAPGLNTVYRGGDRPSSVLIPLADPSDDLPPEPGCGAPIGYRCYHPQ